MISDVTRHSFTDNRSGKLPKMLHAYGNLNILTQEPGGMRSRSTYITYLQTHLPTDSLTYRLTYLQTHLPTDALTYSLTYLHTYSFTHLLTYPPNYLHIYLLVLTYIYNLLYKLPKVHQLLHLAGDKLLCFSQFLTIHRLQVGEVCLIDLLFLHWRDSSVEPLIQLCGPG